MHLRNKYRDLGSGIKSRHSANYFNDDLSRLLTDVIGLPSQICNLVLFSLLPNRQSCKLLEDGSGIVMRFDRNHGHWRFDAQTWMPIGSFFARKDPSGSTA